ncbi:hypothetical protein GGP77_003438 [Salinibacter ruber]|nr:hypothetical protein [Salinibacter ruber]
MKPNPTTFPIEKRASLNVSAVFSALTTARNSVANQFMTK